MLEKHRIQTRHWLPFQKEQTDDSETLPVGAYIEHIMSTPHNSSAGLSERINNQSCGGLQWMNQG